jgi:prolyl oligopeptidase
LNYDLFKKDFEDRVEGFQYRRYLLPLNQLDGVHTVNQLADALRFTTLKDYEDWLARLKDLSVRIEQTIALMRQGVKEGIVYPKVVLQRVPAQLDHQIVGDPKASPLYKPFTRFPRRAAKRRPAAARSVGK